MRKFDLENKAFVQSPKNVTQEHMYVVKIKTVYIIFIAVELRKCSLIQTDDESDESAGPPVLYFPAHRFGPIFSRSCIFRSCIFSRPMSTCGPI